MGLKVLVTPLAAGAYFDAVEAVAATELRACFGVEARVERTATTTALAVDLPASAAPALLRLSFVQAVFEDEGGAWRLVDAEPGWGLPAALVFGAKYRGKTNELVTQLAINLARAACTATIDERGLKLLDPMAGRGTTLLWAARYGMTARGIERDPRALDDLARHVGRQTKLLRIKHERERGGGKKGAAFVGYRFRSGAVRLLTGDARDARTLLGGERFHLLVSDLPYGIEHRGGPGGRRDPLQTLAACAPGWADSLHPGGAAALVFNRLLPKRAALIEAFEAAGLQAQALAAAHRMSESIHRDVVVLTKPT